MKDNSTNYFLNFVSENPPPCLPKSAIYWFNEETGEIRLDDNGVKALVLDEDWNWKIIDPDNGEIIEVNKNQYFCITKEDAKKFRDKVGKVKYAIFKPDPNGLIVVNNEKYSFVITKAFDTVKMDVDQCYIDYIVDTDAEIQPGMVVWCGRNACLVMENGVKTDCVISSFCRQGKRILEKILLD